MARRAFYSFHYKPDNWRASQVRQMGVLEGNSPCSDNDWETITRGGDAAIQRWIDNQLDGKSCAIILVGTNTAGRKWIDYEIKKAWTDGKGVFGIHVHNLKDLSGDQCTKGANPFTSFTVGSTSLSSIVKCHDPPYSDSKAAYGYIKTNLEAWIETAITIRGQH